MAVTSQPTSLPTKSFQTMVSNIAAGVQGRASALVNFAIGSTLRAIAEGFAGLFLWFQALVLQLLTAIRLATCVGVDVDTFTVQFMAALPGSQTSAVPTGSPRLGAQASSGQVTFTRFTAGPSSPFIPVGSTVKTSDGLQTFQVTADPTYGTYSSQKGGYTLPARIATITVPVQDTVPGSSGNVAAGSISVMTSTLVGIDSVSNAASFTNGADQESDGSLKSRFAAFILGLSRGDIYGLTSSIEGTDVTVQWTLTESYDYSNGAWHPAYFFVIADDGSGNPAPAFLQVITNAANAVRPLGTQCAVFPPTVVWADVAMELNTASGYDHNTVVAQVAATIATNINSLGLGTPLEFGMLYTWAFGIAGVTNVTAVTLNGLSGDAASIATSKTTQDGFGTINYIAVKARNMIIS